jgi:hypothetical protein
VVITKPDFIGDPSESAWGDLIAGKNKNFPLVPAHGVHPVRCRKAREYRENMSAREVTLLGERLFGEESWQELAALTGRKFGWLDTSRVLSTAYKKLVKNKWVILS